ncbi:beta-lactamase family protein [Oceanicola sp. D3]|nr:beta-lactamase family protein [Oceanicola sp. D3]
MGLDAAWIHDDGEEGQGGEASRVWPWWSFSKTIIAGCALRLSQEGALDLEAPYGGPHTLRQLLQHRAGVPCYGGLRAYHDAVARGDTPWSRERLVREAGSELLFAPGEGWAYSNIGYMLAREAVEAAAGCDIGSLAARYYAEPLALATMRLAEVPGDFAESPGAAGYHPGWVYHRCFMGSARDAARLVGVLALELGGQPVHRLGGGIEGRPWSETGYGLGVMAGAVEGAGRVVGHSGSGPFSHCAIYHFADVARPVSVATFGTGASEAGPEWEAVRIALGG